MNKKSFSIRLSTADVEFLKTLGSGSMVEGVRLTIAILRGLQEAAKPPAGDVLSIRQALELTGRLAAM